MVKQRAWHVIGKKTLVVSLWLLAIVMLAGTISTSATTQAQTGTIYTVTNTMDSGLGSLRQAIDDANNNPGPDTIDFDLVYPATIQYENHLPLITDDLTILGPGSDNLIIDSHSYRGLYFVPDITGSITGITIQDTLGETYSAIYNYGTLSLADCVIRGHKTAQDGGAIRNSGNLTIQNGVFSENSAQSTGGAIYNTYPGKITIHNSIFSGNSAENGTGGAIFSDDNTELTVISSTLNGNSSLWGGGAISSEGTLTIENSTLYDNVGHEGGAINSFHTLTLVNSTLSGNIANNQGGGLAVRDGTATITSSTITDNTSGGNASGIYSTYSSTVTVQNSIVAGNHGSPDCNGLFSEGHNLDSDGSCGFDLTGDPGLSPLADNGGPTLTRMPLAGSPAIDAADDVLCAADPVLDLDQRGELRGFDADSVPNHPEPGDCDLGAVERYSIADYITIDDVIHVEGNQGTTTYYFTVNRGIVIDGVVTVNFSTVDGTATAADNDYVPTAGTLTFNPGETTQVAEVLVNGDINFEQDETFIVQLSNPSGAEILDTEANGVIEDDDLGLQVFTVTADDDSDDGECGSPPGHCSLREAILAANSTPGQDGITFDLPWPTTITLNAQLPNIEDDVIIQGPGPDNLMLDTGNGSFRIFHVGGLLAGGENVVATIQGMTLQNGHGMDEGGAIYNRATLTLIDCVLRDNEAVHRGGAIFNEGTLTVERSTLSGNHNLDYSFRDGGGAIFNDDNATTHITDSVLSGNTAVDISPGGAIFNSYYGVLSITNSTIHDNDAYHGGGVYNDELADATITDCTFSSNIAESGGGIYTRQQSDLTITGTTFYDNRTTSFSGGAIQNNEGFVILSNSTLSGNHSANRGGAWSSSYGTSYLTNVTIVENSSVGFGGGIRAIYGTLYLRNSIVANNSGGTDCYFEYADHQVSYTLDSDSSCSSFYITGDPKLEPLADNGGPTLTHMPLADSPALDAADNAVCQLSLIGNRDQLGNLRGFDSDGIPDYFQTGDCDLGAVERQLPSNPPGQCVQDLDTGALLCTVVNTNHSGPGSLNQAILDTNENPGLDTIVFDIPGEGPHTIALWSELPAITDPVTIDGTTQPDATCDSWPPTLTVQLNGSNLDNTENGLIVNADSTVIRGLVINHFPGAGIRIDGADYTTIECNYLGSDVSGTANLGNGNGIVMQSATGSRIGANGDGLSDDTEQNLISGNTEYGITISDSTDNVIAGNYIGSDYTGSSPLSNGHGGILIASLSNNNTIGGTTSDAANVIAFNEGHGGIINTHVPDTDPAGQQNLIQHNAIFSNAELGIDLSITPPETVDGVTLNDTGDADTGPNALQNYPVLTLATETTIEGQLSSKQNSDFTLEFFSNATCDPSGYGEGERFETMAVPTTVTTDTNGDVSFSFGFAVAVAEGRFITATATDLDGNTSEFSACLEVNTSTLLSVTKIANPTEMPEPGGHVIFTVAVVNDSTTDTAMVNSLTDSVFGDLNGQGDCAAPQSLSADGGSYTCSFSAFVTGEPSTPHINTVTASGTDNHGRPITNTGSATVSFTNVPLTFTVTNLDDNGPGSLRAAILNANANPGYDIIAFHPELYGTIELEDYITITDDLTINGPGPVVIKISGTGQQRLFVIENYSTVLISGLALIDAYSGRGSAVVVSWSTLTLDNVWVADNEADRGGAGGISASNSTISIRNSTFSGNHGGAGGAIYLNHSDLNITNSTFSNNSATYEGGVIYNWGGEVSIINATFAHNWSYFSEGQVIHSRAGYDGDDVVIFINSILFDSLRGDHCDFDTYPSGVDGGHNLADDDSCGFIEPTSREGVDPLLGDLGYNGGETPTHPLLSGSPAIDAGDPITCASAFPDGADNVDQRKAARPYDGDGVNGAACDIGAVEMGSPSNSLVVYNSDDDGEGSLRTAIEYANSKPNFDVIAFVIPGTGLHTIALDSSLPEITDPVIIDGTTQPGASCASWPPTLMIEVDAQYEAGPDPGIQQALWLEQANDSLIRGLVINRAMHYGIVVNQSENVAIECNFIGTDVTGTVAKSVGIGISVAESTDVRIGSNSSPATARNLISGNSHGGIAFGAGSSNIVIAGNYIGTSVDPAVPLGNGISGIAWMENATGSTIGGTTIAAQNVIAFNDGAGILSSVDSIRQIPAGEQNTVLINSIHSNDGLGIDLAESDWWPDPGDGVTPNDYQDVDTGPNGYQNYPVLISASPTTVAGTLNSTPSTTFTLKFYSNTTCDASGYGEGEQFEAMTTATTVTTDTNGDVSFSFDFATAVVEGHFITATATDPAGSTSEFSACMEVTTASVTCAVDTIGIYRDSDASWYLRNSNSSGYADIIFKYGLPSDQSVTGDWNGDGIDTVGIYRNGSFFLKNSNDGGFADLVFTFGLDTDIPVAGDWDGDGIDTIGVYRPSIAGWFLRNSNTAGPPDISFIYGLANETPVIGDWDGDGVDTVGIYRDSDFSWYLHNSNAGGFAEIIVNYGLPSDDAIVGDWDGDCDDTIGIYRPSTAVWYLKTTNTSGIADISFTYGLPNERAVTGVWVAGPGSSGLTVSSQSVIDSDGFDEEAASDLLTVTATMTPGTPTETPTPTGTLTLTETPTPTETPPATPVPFDGLMELIESDAVGVARTGDWASHDTELASGGSYLYSSDTPGDSLSLSFTGPRLEVVYVQHPALGRFAIEVDGQTVQEVDAYNSKTVFDVRAALNLPAGEHEVRVVALDGTIALDTFVIPLQSVLTPTVTVTPTTTGTDEAATPSATPTGTLTLTETPTETSTALPDAPTDEPTVTLTPSATPTSTATPMPGALPVVDACESADAWTVEDGWQLTPEAGYVDGAWWADGASRDTTSTLVFNLPLDLRGTTAPRLTFWQRVALMASDTAQVELSTDGGATWLTLDQQSDLTADWTLRTIDLTAYNTTLVTLRFSLNTVGELPELTDVMWGWWLDVVVVEDIVPDEPTSTPTPIATLEPSETPTSTPIATATVEPTATLTNTVTPTATLKPTATREPSATPTSTATSTATPEPSATSTSTATSTATLGPTATLLPTVTHTPIPPSEILVQPGGDN